MDEKVDQNIFEKMVSHIKDLLGILDVPTHDLPEDLQDRIIDAAHQLTQASASLASDGSDAHDLGLSEKLMRSEIAKARIDEGLKPEEKRQERSFRLNIGQKNKGVHEQHPKGKQGQSIAGYDYEMGRAKKATGKPDILGWHQAAKNAHKTKIKELKQMPKPKLTKAMLEHHSPIEGLKEIDPKYAGTGVDQKRNTAGNKISYFYFKGTKPESVVIDRGQNKYHVDIPDEHIYDIGSDPMGHIAKLHQDSQDRNVNRGIVSNDEIHNKLKDLGYKGFYHSKHETLPNVVGLYVPSKVKE